METDLQVYMETSSLIPGAQQHLEKDKHCSCFLRLTLTEKPAAATVARGVYFESVTLKNALSVTAWLLHHCFR